MDNKPKELSQIQEAERMYCGERLSARIIATKIRTSKLYISGGISTNGAKTASCLQTRG